MGRLGGMEPSAVVNEKIGKGCTFCTYHVPVDCAVCTDDLLRKNIPSKVQRVCWQYSNPFIGNKRTQTHCVQERKKERSEQSHLWLDKRGITSE